jgi:hypothetical protein
MRLYRTLIPETVSAVILADCGIGRAEGAAVCQELGFDYLARIRPGVAVACVRDRVPCEPILSVRALHMS